MELLFILLILIFYGIFFYLRKRFVPKIKGALGEYKVSIKLRHLKDREYIVLNDILLKNGNSTTQIDHIVICKSGVIVIETKYYKGWIHGHQNSEYWRQTIFKHKNKLRNPIKQNWVHVYAIKKLLSKNCHIKYFPVVVFAGSGKLKNITSSLPVVYLKKLLSTIKNLNVEENLSYNQMKLISDKIHQHNIIDRKISKNHLREVKKRTQERKKKEKLKICPRCGNQLVKRKGKYGQFYGCQNYPKCRYTLNLGG